MASTIATTIVSCGGNNTPADDFDYVVDRFADIEVLRYKVPDFDSLSLNQKQLVYHLTQAALVGRDILWDQNGRYNLAIRDLLEAVYTNYDGNRNSDEFKAFEQYLKQVWFANGIYHHYSNDKFTPQFSREFIETQVAALPEGAISPDTDLTTLYEVIFNPEVLPKKVNQAEGQDLIRTSAVNMYDGLTQNEVESYYAAIKDTTVANPISYGLNTRLVKENGKVVEQTYKLGGLYSEAIEKIIGHLTEAAKYAENDKQLGHINKLIEYYTTGDLRTFDEYSILWVPDTDS